MPVEEVNKIEQSELNPEMQQEDVAPSGGTSPPNEELPGEEIVESFKKGDTIIWKGKLGKIINVKDVI